MAKSKAEGQTRRSEAGFVSARMLKEGIPMAERKQDQREYKDRFFKYLFGNEKYKQFTLDLYNALNDTHYTDPEEITFNTLEEVLFIHMKNDVSFMIRNEVNLWEQQSTDNGNIPLRELLYYTELIQRELRKHGRNPLHNIKRYKIPFPRFFVFYNGTSKKAEEEYLYLEDSFERTEKSRKPSVSVSVKCININTEDGSHTLLEACRPLMEYSALMERIRERKDVIGLDDAITESLKQVPENYVIHDAVQAALEEIRNMLLAEFDEEQYRQAVAEEGYEEGYEKGHQDERRKTVFRMFEKGMSDQDILDFYGNLISEEELSTLRNDWTIHTKN